MTKMHIILRNGPSISKVYRKVLFTLAQYMIKKNIRNYRCDIESEPTAVCEIRTEFKSGRIGSLEGTIFITRFECGGFVTELIFLAPYREDWCDQFVVEADLADENPYWKN